MTAERFRRLAASEAATADELRRLGNDPQSFGSGELSARARHLQRMDSQWPPDLNRWLQDNLVRTRAGSTVYVDAKFSFPHQENHSIEMRSLVAAQLTTRDVWFIFSHLRRPASFRSFRPMRRDDVPTGWPCCESCGTAYRGATSPFMANEVLPRYCPRRETLGPEASGTPFFVIRPGSFFRHGDPFGILPPPPAGCETRDGYVYGDHCRSARTAIQIAHAQRVHDAIWGGSKPPARSGDGTT